MSKVKRCQCDRYIYDDETGMSPLNKPATLTFEIYWRKVAGEEPYQSEFQIVDCECIRIDDGEYRNPTLSENTNISRWFMELIQLDECLHERIQEEIG